MATTGARPGRRMVSLGKVTAPKPINLPSQRSENNGLDPSVNLVKGSATTWATDNAAPKDPQGSWPGSSGPTSGPSSQQPPVPRAGSGQGAAWGGAGLPEVRQATALLSKDEFPTLGTAADDTKRRESSRLSNRGSDMDGGRGGHWDTDDRAVDHEYRGREYDRDYDREYDRGGYDRYGARDPYYHHHERDWGPRQPPPPPPRRGGYDGTYNDDYYPRGGRYSPEERRRDDGGYYNRGGPYPDRYRDQPPPPPPRGGSGYGMREGPPPSEGPDGEEGPPRERRDWGPREGSYRPPAVREGRDWDYEGPPRDGPPRPHERSNGYGHHGSRNPRVPPPPPRRPAETDHAIEQPDAPQRKPIGAQQRFTPEWGRGRDGGDGNAVDKQQGVAQETNIGGRKEEEQQVLPDTPRRSPGRSPAAHSPSHHHHHHQQQQPTKVILKRDPPPPASEAPPSQPQPEPQKPTIPPPPPPSTATRTTPKPSQPSQLPVARDPVLQAHDPHAAPHMQPGAPSVQQQMQQLQQAQPQQAPSVAAHGIPTTFTTIPVQGYSTQLHALFPQQFAAATSTAMGGAAATHTKDNAATQNPTSSHATHSSALPGLQESSLPMPSVPGFGALGGGAKVTGEPLLGKAGLGFGTSLSSGLPTFNLFGPTAFTPIQQGRTLFAPDLLGTGLGSPSGARATPLSTDTTGIGGPLAAAGPTGLGRAPAAAAAAPPSGGMLFGQFGDLSTSPPTKGGVQMPTSTVTAVAAAESVVMEGPSSGQPGSYEEQRLFMQARAAQKKEERRKVMDQQQGGRGRPMQPTTPAIDGAPHTGGPHEHGRGRRGPGRGRGGGRGPPPPPPHPPADDAGTNGGGGDPKRPPRRGGRGGGRGGPAATNPEAVVATATVVTPATHEEDPNKAPPRSKSRSSRRSNSSGGAVAQPTPEGATGPTNSQNAQNPPPPPVLHKSRPRGVRGGRGGRGPTANGGEAPPPPPKSAPGGAAAGGAPVTAQATAPPRAARPRSGGRGRGRGAPTQGEGSASAAPTPAAPAAATA